MARPPLVLTIEQEKNLGALIQSRSRPWLSLSALLALSLTARAGDSILAGTIIVVALAKDHVVVAADSRLGASNGTTVASVDDTYCKIAPLQGKTLFAAAGIVTDPDRNWSADNEMAVAIYSSPPAGRMDTEAGRSAMGRWAESMIRKLTSLPRKQLLAYVAANDGVAATGILAGMDKDANSWAVVSKIAFDGSQGLAHSESSIAPPGSEAKYFGLGKSEIAIEFDHGDTPRATAERVQWDGMNLSGIEFARFKARRLVELTIAHTANNADVGGPVDEIELDAGGLHWIQVKPHCAPEDQH